SLQLGRYRHTTVQVQNRIYTFGGMSFGGVCLMSYEWFTITNEAKKCGLTTLKTTLCSPDEQDNSGPFIGVRLNSSYVLALTFIQDSYLAPKICFVLYNTTEDTWSYTNWKFANISQRYNIDTHHGLSMYFLDTTCELVIVSIKNPNKCWIRSIDI